MPRKNLKKWVPCAYWLLAMLYWETLVHLGMYDAVRGSFRFALGFSAAIGLGIGALCCLLPRRAVFPFSLVMTVVLAFVYGSQLVYCFIFATPYSVSQMGLGANAVNSFWRETLGAMWGHFPWLIGLFLPVVVLVLIRKSLAGERSCRILGVAPLLLAAALILVTRLDISRGGTAMFSDYYFFSSAESTTAQTVERFGVPTTFFLELTHTASQDLPGAEEDSLLLWVPQPVPLPETTPTAAPQATAPAQILSTDCTVQPTAATQAPEPPTEFYTAAAAETVPQAYTSADRGTIPSTAVPETAPETAPEPVKESVPETLPEAASETVSQTVPETLREAAPEALLEAAPETIPETIPETLSEAAPETIPETIPETAPPETQPAPPEYNILEVDFDALNQTTQDSRLLALNNYFSQLPGTQKNAFTGMLRDYNLILICAESFSPAAVHPQVTPTLYRLTHEGFLFRNFYTCYPNTTTDGEYILMQGLFPDAARGKYDSSMLMSQRNALPFVLGNAFRDQRGIQSYGYHNYLGSYYNRVVTHANMGYQMKFSQDGMTFSSNWPASDLEMMEQSVDDYIHQPQFNVYYMTFSGHYQYSFSTNGIAAGNRDAVKDLPLSSEEEKAYLACHVELDKALEYLLNRLEEEGVADHTAIILAADHTPYGLSKASFYDLIGQPEDFFTWYKSDLVFWVGGMDENIEVEQYCCDVDILPTLLNLWGLSYDSRMLAGTDVFSDSLHVAVLSNHSFLTDQVWFNSNTGETRYLVDPALVPENYIENMNQMISARFNFSAKILQSDYYRFAFGE